MTEVATARERLRRMREIRHFEERITELRGSGEVVGSVHLCNGQEAIYVGTADVLQSGLDAVFPTYRGHGWALALGSDPYQLFSELMGRETGTNRGRGGSAYLSDPDHDMYGENSIVGAGAPIASGAALASKFDGSGRVAVASFGDGTVNQGAVSEAFNFAAIMRLPVVFIIENNGWSELTPIADMTVNPSLFKRGTVFGMPGGRADGNDCVAVAEAVGGAVKRARSGQGPAVVELMTERLVGHYIGDPQTYRTSADIEEAQQREPIVIERKRLADLGVPSAELDQLEQEAISRIDDAAARALEAPLADPTTVLEHLYA